VPAAVGPCVRFVIESGPQGLREVGGGPLGGVEEQPATGEVGLEGGDLLGVTRGACLLQVGLDLGDGLAQLAVESG